MKHTSLLVTVGTILALLVGVAGATAQEPAPQEQVAVTAAVGTAFTYQGRLNDGGIPASSDYDFQFALYDALTGGNQLGSTFEQTITVDDGYFATLLDFGQVFLGEARYLEVRVRTAGTGDPFTTLTPRQALTPVPYSLALPGLWTEQNVTSPNVIGGHGGNTVAGVVGATIGGGGRSDSLNAVHDNYGTVAGGIGNRAGSGNGDPEDGAYATVGGGNGNLASGNYATAGGGLLNGAIAFGATVAGGINSSASGNASFVGGGQHNTASNDMATVPGGYTNIASGSGATVGGGTENIAAGNAAAVGGGQYNHATGSYATVPGGSGNLAAGDFSLAAGRRAKANHPGAFVWGDSTDADVVSTANDQFVIRASGGVSVTAGTGIWRLEPNATSPNLISGYSGNSVTGGIVGATIGGGGASIGLNTVTGNYGTVAGGIRNTVRDHYGTVGGGVENLAHDAATVGGGWNNQASSNWSTVGGGAYNRIDAESATVAGGWGNHVSGSTGTIGGGSSNSASQPYTTVGGGIGNQANGSHATIGGGFSNLAGGASATIPGGQFNNASGDFAAVNGGQDNQGINDWTVVGGGQNNVASGEYSTIGGGTDNLAEARFSTIPGGAAARAVDYGQMAYASGSFTDSGDAQASIYVLRRSTTDATPTSLLLDGSSQHLTIPVSRTMTFEVWIVARTETGQSAGYRSQGVIENQAGTTGFVGAPTVTTLGEDVAAWNVTVLADDANDALVVQVIGAAGSTIRWVATVRTAEVAW